MTDIAVSTNNPDRAWVTFSDYNNVHKVCMYIHTVCMYVHNNIIIIPLYIVGVQKGGSQYSPAIYTMDIAYKIDIPLFIFDRYITGI